MTREVMQQALMTLENVNPSLVCEMAHHPKKDQHGIGQKCPLEIRHLETITAIKKALAQPPLPVQKPLTDEAVDFECRKHFWMHSTRFEDAYNAGFRDAEAAHNIKEQP